MSKRKLNLVEYFEAFIAINYHPTDKTLWTRQDILNDFIRAASEGVYRGGYMKRTIPNLIASYKAGKSVESLGWEGA